MKIYTKAGDQGKTALLGGPKVWKDDVRIDTYGTVDELNAFLGLARCELATGDGETGGVDLLLCEIQSDLFDLGAALAAPDPRAMGVLFDRPDRIASLEGAIDRYEADLPTLKNFILPAGTRTASLLHVSRTVCRRAERATAGLLRDQPDTVTPGTLIYLNRLSDLLFVLARHANHSAGIEDVPWKRTN